MSARRLPLQVSIPIIVGSPFFVFLLRTAGPISRPDVLPLLGVAALLCLASAGWIGWICKARDDGTPVARFSHAQVFTALILLCGITWALTMPGVSDGQHRLLASGTVRWEGQPVPGAGVQFFGITPDGGIGDPVVTVGAADGSYAVLTGRRWRKRNPGVSQFAVTVSGLPDKIPPAQYETLSNCAQKNSTPIRVRISEYGTENLNIELSDWAHRSRP